MAVGKEIRGKIKSVEGTKKITKAMEMVAASKMRKAQERMRAARPYADKIRNIAANLAQANPEYKSPYMRTGGTAKTAGMIVVTTDKGLCGGLNTNILRAVTTRMRELQEAGHRHPIGGDRQQGHGLPGPDRRQGHQPHRADRRRAAARPAGGPGQGDARRLRRRRGRLGAPVLHALHQHDEAGAGDRAVAAAEQPSACSRARKRRPPTAGTTSTSPTP